MTMIWQQGRGGAVEESGMWPQPLTWSQGHNYYFSGPIMDINLTFTEYPDPENIFRLKFCLDFPEIFKLEL